MNKYASNERKVILINYFQCKVEMNRTHVLCEVNSLKFVNLCIIWLNG